MKIPFLHSNSGGTLGIDSGNPDGASLVYLTRNKHEGARILHSDRISWEKDNPGQELADYVRENLPSKVPTIGVIALNSYNLLLIDAPNVAWEEMGQAVRWQIKDLIDYPLEEAVVDYFSAPQSPGRGRMVYVVSAQMEVVQRQVDLLQRAKLKVKAIDIPELVLRNVASLLPEAQQGLGLLFLGPKSGIILVVQDEYLYVSRYIQHGSEAMARNVQSQNQEDLLDKSGDLQMILENVVLNVQRTLDYYESNFGKTTVATVYLAPLQDDVPGLVEYLQDNLGAEVKDLDLNALFPEADMSQGEQAQCFFALGAALRQGRGN